MLRPKKNVVFPVTLPTPIFGPYPKAFIEIFLFLIKSYIMLFVWTLNWTKYNVGLDNLYDFLKIPKSLHIIYLFLWLPPWTPVNILKLNLLASWSLVSIKWE